MCRIVATAILLSIGASVFAFPSSRSKARANVSSIAPRPSQALRDHDIRGGQEPIVQLPPAQDPVDQTPTTPVQGAVYDPESPLAGTRRPSARKFTLHASEVQLNGTKTKLKHVAEIPVDPNTGWFTFNAPVPKKGKPPVTYMIFGVLDGRRIRPAVVTVNPIKAKSPGAPLLRNPSLDPNPSVNPAIVGPGGAVEAGTTCKIAISLGAQPIGNFANVTIADVSDGQSHGATWTVAYSHRGYWLITVLTKPESANRVYKVTATMNGVEAVPGYFVVVAAPNQNFDSKTPPPDR